MNRPRNRMNDQRRSGGGPRPEPVDIWRAAGELPDVEPITVPDEVGALLRSLGDPPMIGGRALAGHYYLAVIERTAAVASALALSADLLASPDDD